ncbi:MAG: RluA family pseudouridine synthase [Methylobacterium sp.]|nr:RluA family pseudouridine synthase [Methylobacterium sp.]MCA3638287.1 RluA family pseudouridine synthase [Methylobacterium sp.]
MGAVTTRHVKDDEAGMRLDRWFKAHFPDLAFGHLQKLLRTGQVRVDGARARAETRIAPGQVIRIPPMQKPELLEAPREGIREAGAGVGHTRISAPKGEATARPVSSRKMADDLEFLKSIILYEDRDMMVLNKPHGLAVQGGSGTTRHVDGLLEVLRDKDGQKPRLVHRLDKDTAGCLIIAKTRLAASTLAATFRSRAARKIYWALSSGVPRVKQGRISTWLAKGEDEYGDQKMKVARHGDEGADHALTYYAVVETAGQKLSWLSLKPVTGRMHQLRVHAAEIGHPIIGDPKYFNRENWELPGGIQQKLHLLARRIVIPHPRENKMVDVSAPLPPHMQQSWNLLGFDTSSYDPIEDAPEK